jgi:hypothetical protein
MELPQEIWNLIVGDNGLILKSLFLVSKLLHKYMDQVKDQYVFNTMSKNNNSSFLRNDKHYQQNEFKNSNLILVKYDNATYDLKYNNTHYILDMPYDKQNTKNIFNNLKFCEYNYNYVRPNALGVYVCGKLEFVINDKNIYNYENLNDHEPIENIYDLCKLVKDQICDDNNSDDDAIKLALIGLGCDVVSTILFLTSS